MANDFLAQADPFADLFKPKPAVQTMNPEEEQSILSSLGQKSLGGLHYAGSSLGKAFGGRAIRGALGGHLRELLSIIPFSDTMGLTDEKDEVHGEDLAKQWGLLHGEGQKGTFEARDLVGPAIEAALDPGTYLSFGTKAALTQGGKAAAKAGALAPTMAGRIAAKQAGLLGVGLPFMEKAPLLTGATGEKVAGVLGKVGDAALYSKPGRVLSQLFDPNVAINGVPMENAAGQRVARAAQAGFQQKKANAFHDFLGIGDELEKGGILDHGDQLRSVLEGTAEALPNTVQGQALGSAAGKARSVLDNVLDQARQVGRPVNELMDEMVGYAPRQMTLPEKLTSAATVGRGQRALPTGTPHDLARLDMLRNVPGGADAINQMVSDPALRELATGPNPLAAQEYIRRTYLGHGPAEEAERFAINQLAPEARIRNAEGISVPNPVAVRQQALNGVHKQAEQLADWIPTLDPETYVTQGKKFFGNHALSDIGLYLQRHAKAQAGSDAVHDLLASTAQVGRPAPGMVPLKDALTKAGLGFQEASGEVGGQSEALRRLIDKGVLPQGSSLHDLANVVVPESAVSDATRFSHGFHVPEALQPIVNAYDSLTNLTKAGMTSLWPSFHSRNALTGLWQNFVIGARDHRFGALDPRSYLQPIKDALALRNGKAIEGANQINGLAHLTDEQATRRLAEEMFERQARVGISNTQGGEALGLGTHAEPVELRLPGRQAEPGLGDIFSSMKARDLVPDRYLNVRGVGGRTLTGNTIVKAAQQLGGSVDDINRASAYIALRRQGYTADAAAKLSKAAHYDYCVDETTEALTRRGWCNYRELTVEDEVLTIHPQTRQIEWNKVEAVNIFHREGEMIRWRSQVMDALTTENHRWLAQGSGIRGGDKRLIPQRKEQTHFVTTSEADEREKILLVGGGIACGCESEVFDDDFVRMAGWVLTEGWYHKQCPSGVFASQSAQANPDHVQEIRELIVRLQARGLAAYEHSPRDHGWGPICTFYFGMGLGDRLRAVLPGKRLTAAFLTQLTAAQLEILYEVLQKGDGTKSSRIFSQKDESFTDAFQMLCAMLGKRSRKRKNGVCFHTTPYLASKCWANGLISEKENYSGDVWCPTTRNGTWMARRNGLTYWTGNSHLTGFEREVMRRVAPFYNWTRQNLPFTLEQMLTRPGGPTAQAVKLTDALRHKAGDWIPDYLGQGVALPMSQEEDGRQRFLSHFGLPFEDVTKLIGGGPHPIRQSAMEAASEMNPILKMPLELLSGKQFYSGRDLADLHGPTGNVAVDQLLMNSPLSRVYTTGRTLLDERKGLGAKAFNLLSPGRLTDVDMDKYRAIAAREMADEKLKGSPNVKHSEDVYVPKDLIGQISPEQLQLLRLKKTLEAEAQARKKAAQPTNIGFQR